MPKVEYVVHWAPIGCPEDSETYYFDDAEANLAVGTIYGFVTELDPRTDIMQLSVEIGHIAKYMWDIIILEQTGVETYLRKTTIEGVEYTFEKRLVED